MELHVKIHYAHKLEHSYKTVTIIAMLSHHWTVTENNPLILKNQLHHCLKGDGILGLLFAHFRIVHFIFVTNAALREIANPHSSCARYLFDNEKIENFMVAY